MLVKFLFEKYIHKNTLSLPPSLTKTKILKTVSSQLVVVEDL